MVFYEVGIHSRVPGSLHLPGVIRAAFGSDQGAAFLLCAFATDLVAAAAFARARAALLAAARLSGDHGVS
jgi:hypothetical protein